MLDIDRAAYEAEAQQIRLTLKAWETKWARDHGGAKPGRDDIKGNDIAEQYKAYNRVRGILSGKTAPKRKDADTLITPSKRRAVDVRVDAGHETPSISRKLFSPVVPTSIGPTPQRDGRVLGLFDVLAEEQDSIQRRQRTDATPSRRDARRDASLLGSTPRKQTIDVSFALENLSDSDDDGDDNNVRRLGRTPMSSGRRNLLNHFTAPPPRPPQFDADARGGALGTTPLKARNGNSSSNAQATSLTTPSKKAAPVEFATPAFLRRQTSSFSFPSVPAAVDENGTNDENSNIYFCSPPNKRRLPQKPMVRGLSSVLASLRKAEDDRLDEEADIMRELEEAAEGRPARAAQAGATKDSQMGPEELQKDREQEELEQLEALMEESNEKEGGGGGGGKRLLGGFDDEGLYDSEPEQAHDRGQPLRVYKKKGQKRTTRLVNMRPTRTKRAVEVVADGDGDGDGDGDEDNVGVVPETQVKPGDEEGDGDGLYRDVSDEEGTKANTKKTNTKKTKTATTKKTATTTTEAAKEGTVKKAVRKVNELAHANFKRLKIKNTGTKGGPRFNSRFRRRR